MRCIELFPDLSHCIETVARQEFWSSVKNYMANDREDPELKDKIELLKAGVVNRVIFSSTARISVH